MAAEKIEKSKLKAENHRSKLKIALRPLFRILGFFVVIVALNGSYLFAAEKEGISRLARYRVFSLRHISAQQGKKYLALTNIATVSQLPGSDALLVTAEPHQLIKATAILELVDTNEPFVIKTICPASEASSLPSNKEIATELSDMSIGTFSEPPTGLTTARAIIDTHDDAVVLIAPAKQLQRITSTIDQLQKKTKLPAAQPAEPNQTDVPTLQPIPEPKPDELFSKLLNSLAKTEKRSAQPPISSELLQVRPEQPQQPSLPVVVKEPVAEDAAEKLKPEPKPAPEQLAAEIEPPAEVAEPAPETPALQEPPKVRSYEPELISTSDETLELDLPEKLNIIDLFDLVGKYLHLDYMYDDNEVKGEIALRIQGPIKVKDLYPLLESVLKFKGFVMTRKGNLVTIVPAAKVLDIDPDLYTDADKVEVGDIMITRIFELNYIDTATAKNLLEGMKVGVSITAIPETGTLIVTGYAYRMARIEKLLTMIDKPGTPREFRFRQLKYTMAKTLAPKVKTLIEQMGTISITIARPAEKPPSTTRRRGESETAFKRRQAAARRAAAAKRPAAVKPTAAKPTVYLDADERTNRILMIGNEDELDIVEQLIDTLDIAQQDLRTLRLYEIQYVGAEEVREKLAELGIIGSKGITTRITAERRDTKQPASRPPTAASELLAEEPQVVIIESTNSLLVNATAEQHAQIAHILAYVDSQTLEKAIPYEVYPLENQNPEDLAGVLNQLIQETIKDKEGKIQQVINKKEEKIEIIADESTFSLIVYANRKNQEWISKLIKQLDKRRPQVLIDTTLVEISEVDSFTYDLQLVSKFPELAQGGQMDLLTAILGNPGDPGTFFPLKTVTEATSILGEGGGGKGFYADRHIQALLTLMQTKGYGRVLAKPKLLVNDNEEGSIRTENVLYAVRRKTTGAPETQFVSESFSVESYPSGIELTITPHISEGDLLRLEIVMKRSSQPAPAAALGETDPPPNKTENTINTIVTVPDNSTIILGGILTLDQAKDNWKVPLLGDIPIVGGLFRKITDNSRQSKLYVFVKANILRPSETEFGLPDLERISDRNRAAFEKSETEFQRYEEWPGIEPEPMDPLHVLETE